MGSRGDWVIESREIEHRGLTFRVELEADQGHPVPWEDGDGRGVVVDRRERERLIEDMDAPRDRFRPMGDQGHDLYFDWEATRAKAAEESWGVTPEKAAGLTQDQILDAAVEQEYEFLRGYCTGAWSYIGIVVSLQAFPDATRSVWGIESDDEALLIEVAQDLAEELLDELPAALDAEIARLQLVRKSLAYDPPKPRRKRG